LKLLTPTSEIIKDMDDKELRVWAKGRALSAADSSRIEGLILAQDRLEEDFFKLYKELKEKNA
jgi:hypothetical protein